MRIANYIDGRFSDSTAHLTVFDPSYGTEIASVADSPAREIEAAVAAARRAQPEWAARGFDARREILQRARDEYGRRRDELVQATMRNVGTPRRIADAVQIGIPEAIIDSILALPTDIAEGVEIIGNSHVFREPVGVVGAITPWNYPVYMTVSKVFPALLAGNAVVLKPSEVAPLPVAILTAIMVDAGLPAGVFNVVHGRGTIVGEALASHPDVDMVSFTGSTAAGRRVAAAAAANVTRVSLELGGKGANILLDDVDLAPAVKSAVNGAFLNSGQTCLALTRLLVHRDRYEEAVELAADVARRLPPGPYDDPAARMGPMVSSSQRDRVRAYIARGIEDGARLVVGGLDSPEGLDGGYFVQPTVFADVRTDMVIAQEEIFGPVLVVIPYEDDDDAVRIANDTVYGLTAGVRSADPHRAMSIARRLQSGQVEVNAGAYNPAAPFGGVKQSGYGRELGLHGLHEFTQLKSVQL